MGNKSQGTHIGKIFAVNLSDTCNRTIIHEGLGYSLQVAVNWITKKLYWYGVIEQPLNIQIFMEVREKLLEDVANVQTIALDPCSDYIY